MMQPNWFDKKYCASIQNASAQEFLMELAADEQMIKAVNGAMAAHDQQKAAKKIGPSRTQLVRRALAEALQADA
jgi:hypothetical protein